MLDFETHLYSRAARPTTAERHAVALVGTRLDKYSKHLRRAGVRLTQLINASGQLDWTCRVEVAMTKGATPKFYVEGRARQVLEAVELAADAVEGAVRREVEGASERSGAGRRRATSGLRGVEVRRGAAARRGAEAREGEGLPELEDEALRRLTPRAVKTANPMRGRHIHKTRRQAQATSARELSATRPSRKSTRKSANRSKRDSNLVRRAKRDTRSPEARAARAASRAG
ncbi:MAG: hypothetical protein KF782_35685, partial [Labilithrix sp.]|nr:hypothetical protein [Labilithrix sp.]